MHKPMYRCVQYAHILIRTYVLFCMALFYFLGFIMTYICAILRSGFCLLFVCYFILDFGGLLVLWFCLRSSFVFVIVFSLLSFLCLCVRFVSDQCFLVSRLFLGLLLHHPADACSFSNIPTFIHVFIKCRLFLIYRLTVIMKCKKKLLDVFFRLT